MERHAFKTEIDVSREKVWEILWGVETYPKWTSVFSETSQVKSDWKEGSKVYFLDGTGNGMVSILEKNNPPEFMSFKHVGIMKDDKEITEGEEVKKWAPAYENYTLKSVNGKTELVVDMDVENEHKEYFIKIWPKAFMKIKELSE